MVLSVKFGASVQAGTLDLKKRFFKKWDATRQANNEDVETNVQKLFIGNNTYVANLAVKPEPASVVSKNRLLQRVDIPAGRNKTDVWVLSKTHSLTYFSLLKFIKEKFDLMQSEDFPENVIQDTKPGFKQWFNDHLQNILTQGSDLHSFEVERLIPQNYHYDQIESLRQELEEGLAEGTVNTIDEILEGAPLFKLSQSDPTDGFSQEGAWAEEEVTEEAV